MIVSAVASAAVAVSIALLPGGQGADGKFVLTEVEMRRHAELLGIEVADVDLIWHNYSAQLEKYRLAEQTLTGSAMDQLWMAQVVGDPVYKRSPNELPLAFRRPFYAEQKRALNWECLGELKDQYFELIADLSDDSDTVEAMKRQFHRDRLLPSLSSDRAQIDVQKVIDDALAERAAGGEIEQLRSRHESQLDPLLIQIDQWRATRERADRLLREAYERGERTIDELVEHRGQETFACAQVVRLNDALITGLGVLLAERDRSLLNDAWGRALFPYVWQEGEGDRALQRALPIAGDQKRTDALRDAQARLLQLRRSWSARLNKALLELYDVDHFRSRMLLQQEARRNRAQIEPDQRFTRLQSLGERAQAELAQLQKQAILIAEDAS